MKKYIDFFDNYTNEFMENAKSDFERLHLDRKIKHSKRVNKIAVEIAEKMNLKDKEIYLVNVASLFHDIGRFKQFAMYNTYVDKDSVDHALLGKKILEEETILNEFKRYDKEKIIDIVKMHNYRELSHDISDKLYTYASIVRDADKIDIIYSMVNIIPSLSKEDQRVFYSNKKHSTEISSRLVDLILNKEKIIKNNFNTVEEMKLCNISWVTSDIVHKPSFEIIKREELVEKAFEMIPDSDEKSKIFEFINNYIKNI